MDDAETMAEDLLEAAERLRCRGERGRARWTLRSIMQLQDEASRNVRCVAAYQLAIMVLQDERDDDDADELCWRLGFRKRLTTSILSYGRERKDGSLFCSSCIRFENALSEELFGALWLTFYDESKYWKTHNYPTSEFFSHKVAVSSKNLLGQFAAAVRALVAVHFRAAQQCQWAEVWAHKRQADGHHQLHWDLDETRLRSTGEIRAPEVSCVLFLEGDEGPTLVVDARIGGINANSGWLCHPKPNRLLAFDGRLLHGVIPLRRPSPRITLMIGLWHEEPRSTPGGFGPNMPFRKAPWCPSVFSLPKKNDYAKIEPCEPVEPIWHDVRCFEDTKFGDLAVPNVAFSGRFLLPTGPDDIERDVLAQRPELVEFVDLDSLVHDDGASAHPSKRPSQRPSIRKRQRQNN